MQSSHEKYNLKHRSLELLNLKRQTHPTFMTLTQRNQLTRGLIGLVSIGLASAISYSVNYYFANQLLVTILTALLAVVFYQLLQLAFAQLRQAYYPQQRLTYNTSTYEAVTALQQKMVQQLQAWLPNIKLESNYFILDYQHKQFVSADGTATFVQQHSLAYAAKQYKQLISLGDETFFKQLPEVVALDIQLLLKQHHATAVLAAYNQDDIYGFIFLKADLAAIQQLLIAHKHDSIDLSYTFGHLLSLLLQHDAIVLGSPNKAAYEASLQPKSIVKEKLNWQSWVVLGLFVLFTIWWILNPYMQLVFGPKLIWDFTNVYAVTAAWGGVWAIIIAKNFREQKNMRWVFYMFGIGLLLQEFGATTYSIYSYFWNIEVPYPSIGDVGFFGSVVSYIFAIAYLAKASGIAIELKNYRSRLLAIIIPLVMLLIAYLLFLQGYQFSWSHPVRIFLDFSYPLFQAIYVSIAILVYLLTRDTQGSMKNKILFLTFTLFWQFLCDYTFLYQTSRGTWHTAGFNDYMYFISYVLMSLALLRFKRREKISL